MYTGTDDSISDGAFNIYLLSTTFFLALIIAYYYASYSRYYKQKNGLQNTGEIKKTKEVEDDKQGEKSSQSAGSSDEEDVRADGLVGKLKSARLKELEAQLTRDQLEEERKIEREQLAAIFELLKRQEAELNMKEIDEYELSAQLSLYR